MRTTIELPDDLHQLLLAIAHDRRETLSQTTSSLLRKAILPEGPVVVEFDAGTQLPVVRIRRAVTAEDVRRLDDEA